MHLLIILDPVETIKTYKDSTYAMMQAARARGHAISVCEMDGLWLESGHAWAAALPLELIGPQLKEPGHDPHGWWRLGDAAPTKIAQFDAVLMRKDPPFDQEYVYATWLLEHACRAGARVFNAPRAIRDHGEKYSIAEFPQFTAETIVTRDPNGCATSSPITARQSSSCSTGWAVLRSFARGPTTPISRSSSRPSISLEPAV